MRKNAVLPVVLTPVLVVVLTPTPAVAAATPSGYRLAAAQRLAPGVVHETFVRDDPRQVVHVARIARSAPVSLRVVRATPQPVGPTLERMSSMCARVRCIAGVNGDFFVPATGEVLGGVVSAGEPVRSPGTRHHQLTIGRDGALSVGLATWRTTLVTTDLESLPIHAVNVPRDANRLVLYTPAFGASTRTNGYGVELVARIEEPRAPLRLGQTALIRLTPPRVGVGGTPIPRNGIVLSGHGKGARALESLWQRVRSGRASTRALLRIDSDPTAAESMGGAPVLVRGGRRFVQGDGPSFVTGRHPRTAVGWTAKREVLLVTADGRQPGYSLGLSLPELADLMVALGARDAINLDGGGSTTFLARGAVANRPSDRLVSRQRGDMVVYLPGRNDRVVGNLERPVANMLALVPRTPLARLADPLAGGGLGLAAVEATAPPVLDPGSSPLLALPALVAAPVPASAPVPVALVLVLVVATANAVVALHTHRTRGTRRR